ncbi:MAG: type II toxin-antitoxin system RatA family toxin [Gammaproteobacteria bacterium]|jgi:ribosome-associated toxin RatA of RatAB toxin-antitoxin module
MRTIHRSALVPYTPDEMYGLVNDVERYPEFLPWCRSARIEGRQENQIEASLELARGGVHKWFTTRNRLTPGERIDIELVDGPFRRLAGAWQFQSLNGEGCKVVLDMRFEIANPMLGMMLGPVFHQVCNSMVDAFIRRARDIYGSR